MSEEMRKCSKCGIGKNLEEFNKDNRKPSGRTSSCKQCDLDDRKKRLKYKIVRAEKYCPKCKQVLTIESFGNSSNRKDGHDDYCKPCRNKVIKESKERKKNG